MRGADLRDAKMEALCAGLPVREGREAMRTAVAALPEERIFSILIRGVMIFGDEDAPSIERYEGAFFACQEWLSARLARERGVPAEKSPPAEWIMEKLDRHLMALPVEERAALTDPNRPRRTAREALRPYEMIPSNLLYQFVQRAVARAPEGVFSAEDGYPSYSEEKNGFQASMEMRPNDELPLGLHGDPEVILQSMNDKLSALGDVAVDVMDIVFMRHLKSRDPQDTVTITTDEILAARGLSPKRKDGYSAGYRPEEKKLVLSIMGALDNLWIVVGEMEIHERGKARPRRFRERSRLMMVTGLAEQASIEGEFYPVAWRVRLGEVFAALLSSEYATQFALMSSKTLEYDPYRQKWEKRLSRYFHPLWRIRRKDASFLSPVRVATLLEACGQQVYRRNPQRTRERLEQALDTLERDGVIGAWQYEGADEEALGSRGWARRWLEWRVVVEPSDGLLRHYAQPPRRARKPEQQDMFSLLAENGAATAAFGGSLGAVAQEEHANKEGAKPPSETPEGGGGSLGAAAQEEHPNRKGAKPPLARLRAELGLTQLQMAEALGISRSLVAQIEGGRRNMGGKLQARMEALRKQGEPDGSKELKMGGRKDGHP